MYLTHVHLICVLYLVYYLYSTLSLSLVIMQHKSIPVPIFILHILYSIVIKSVLP